MVGGGALTMGLHGRRAERDHQTPKSPTAIGGIRPRKSGSHRTPRWWRKEDSNPRSLSREIRLSGAREVPGAVKTGKPRKASFVLRGTKGSNPSPSSGESIANLFGPETSWVVPHVADPRAH